MLGDLGGPSGSHSLATVFVYRAYRLDLQDHVGRELDSDGLESAECNLPDLGSPEELECKAQGHTDQMSYCVQRRN